MGFLQTRVVKIAGIISRLGFRDQERKQYGVELRVNGNRHSQLLEQPLLTSPTITYKRGLHKGLLTNWIMMSLLQV